MRIDGILRIYRRHPQEPQELVFEDNNLITDVGLVKVTELILGQGIEPVGIATGLDNTAAVVADTTLGNEFFRKDLNRRFQTSNSAQMQMLIGLSEGNGAVGQYVEAGLFDSSAAEQGNMLARIVHDGITKDNTIELTYSWEWVVSRL